MNTQSPDCSIDVQDTITGLDISSVSYKYSKDGGSSWIGDGSGNWIPLSVMGEDGDTDAKSVPPFTVDFGQDTNTKGKNKVKFKARDLADNMNIKTYNVIIDTSTPPDITWLNPMDWTNDQKPDCEFEVVDFGSGLKDLEYRYSKDGGGTWEIGWTSIDFGEEGDNTLIEITKEVDFGQDSKNDNIVKFRATDVLGNQDTTTKTIKIDSMSPSSVKPYYIIQDDDYFKFEWDIPVDIDPSPSSGVYFEGDLYKKIDGEWTPIHSATTAGDTLYLGKEGTGEYKFTLTTKDNAGNSGESTDVVFYYYQKGLYGFVQNYDNREEYLGHSVIVTFASPSGEVIGQTGTNIDGTYSWEPPSPGTYIVTAYRHGMTLFSPQTVEVEDLDSRYYVGPLLLMQDNEDVLIEGKIGVWMDGTTLNSKGSGKQIRSSWHGQGGVKVSTPMDRFTDITSSTGYFSFNAKTTTASFDGSYKLTLSKSGYYNKYMTVTVPYSASTIDLGEITPLKNKDTVGCPYAGGWNGTGYYEGNSILPRSETLERRSRDVVDHFVIDDPVKNNNRYLVNISEFEGDTSYLDKFSLREVHYEGDGELMVTTDGKPFVYTDPYPPLTAINKSDVDVTQDVSGIDQYTHQGFNTESLVCNFGDIDKTDLRILLSADKAPPSSGPGPWYLGKGTSLVYGPIEVEIYSNGYWKSVGLVYPRANYSIEGLDLSGYYDGLGELIVRLKWKGYHPLDFVGIDWTKQPEIITRKVGLINATSFLGSNLTDTLAYSDDDSFRLNNNQYINLKFNSSMDTVRSLILTSEGYYNIPYRTLGGISVGKDISIKINSESELKSVTLYEDNKAIRSVQNINTFDNSFIYRPSKEYYLEFNTENKTAIMLEVSGICGNNIDKFQVENNSIVNLTEFIGHLSGIDESDESTNVPSNESIMFNPIDLNIEYTMDWEYFYWDFGDNYRVRVTNQYVTHSYDIPGEYNVSLMVKYENGQTIKTERTIKVISHPPEPSIKLWREVNVSLRVAGRKDNKVTAEIYEDGALIESLEALRTPGKPNAKVLTLKVHDDKNYSVNLIYNATRRGANPTWLTFESRTDSFEIKETFKTKDGFDQSISYDVDDDLGIVLSEDRLYHFSAEGSYDPDGEILSYDWDFGDGNNDSGPIVSHEYRSEGEYIVSLTATDDKGVKGTKEILLNVSKE